MPRNDKNNLIRVIVAVLVCLVIVAIPLTVKIVADRMTDTEDETRPTEPHPESVTFSIEIGCHRLFGDAGKPYIEDIEKRLGEELFTSLKEGNMVVKEEMTLPYGSSVMDATKAVLKAHGIGIAESDGYISAIGGLAEKMAGAMSGWVYVIDGKQVMTGASTMPIREGVTITWIYLVG